MSSKRRWALNPRKWFGTISSAAHKRDKKYPVAVSVVPLPAPVAKSVRTISSTPLVPRILTSKKKTRITPTLLINDNRYIHPNNLAGTSAPLQLLTFHTGREKTPGLMTLPTSLYRTNTLLPTRLYPSIRKNGLLQGELSIHPARRNTEMISYDVSKLLIPPMLPFQYENLLQQNAVEKQSEMNISHVSGQNSLDGLQVSSNNLMRKNSSVRRSHSLSSSSSSIEDNDVRDESSSSGIFTDERADINDRQCTASKDTLSTVEVLSVESINDSQTSFDHRHTRPLAHRCRLPLSTLETVEDQSARLQSGEPMARSYRSFSAENILKDNSMLTPVIGKNRQSSAAIAKKIEKRLLTGRSPPTTLEKAGLVRVANATYRLTSDKDDHLYRRQRRNSIIQYLPYDDSLPSADNEECYATLPRTSSTEQLTNDLRAIVDECLRPMAELMNQTTPQLGKSSHRSRRSHTNHEHTEINIEDLTDKLLSSVDCSTYSQYQRCY